MAKFQIYLLSLRNSLDNISPRHSLMPISEFNNTYQEKFGLEKHNFKPMADNPELYELDTTGIHYNSAILSQDQYYCYTYDEKFQVHPNSQRTLTFSMNQKIIRADRIEMNPFTNYLFIGAQLLLVDKYDNHHLMTISKISYDFKETNTVFKYECQDSFTYQLSRQNTGYEITNNIDDNSFIGAQSLDWWVLCKIQPECKISYQYLRLEDKYHYKPSFPKAEYADFHRTVPFSASGTANSVLIALGELFGLQLRVYERVNLQQSVIINGVADINPAYGRIDKFYWFEPVKSLRPTGLKYSPSLDLKSFSLDHTGESFSSILNVQSHEIGDTLITLIPTVPSFFRQWFETAEWNNTDFVPGLFLSSCQEKSHYININEAAVAIRNDTNKPDYTDDYFTYNDLLYISLLPHIEESELSERYDFIKFTTTHGDSTQLSFKDNEYVSGKNTWELEVRYNNYKKEDADIVETWYTSKQHTSHKTIKDRGGIKSLYLKIPLQDSGESINTLNGDLYIVEYRHADEDEITFARIADQVPWLENKLIDFQYFLDHSIINFAEHNGLMKLLENNLRKANAKMLVYSQRYFESIRKKTELMSQISIKLDRLGAIFQSDLLDPYLSNEKITETRDLNLAYEDLFQNSTEQIELISYYDTLSDYVNKYFNAEQTFLKNMYLFKKYFNTSCDFGTLYFKTFSFSNEKQYSFNESKNAYTKLTESNKNSSLYYLKDSDAENFVLYDKNELIDDKKLSDTDYYYAKVITDYVEEAKGLWSNETVYYEKQWEAAEPESFFSGVEREKQLDITVNSKQYKLQITKDLNGMVRISCYRHILFNPVDDNSTITAGGYTFTNVKEVYQRVSWPEMKMNYLYKTLTLTGDGATLLPKEDLYIKTPSGYISLKDKLDGNNSYEWIGNFAESGMKDSLLQYIANSKNIPIENIVNIDKDDWWESYTSEFYGSNIPLNQIYWYGKKDEKDDKETEEYHTISFVNYENAGSFYRKTPSTAEDFNKKWWYKLLMSDILKEWVNFYYNTFSNDGWTYTDIFGYTFKPSFQRWTPSSRLMYVKKTESYNVIDIDNIFGNSCKETIDNYDGWKGNTKAYYTDLEDEKDDTARIIAANWKYDQATNLLFTYFSLTKRATSLSDKYFYKTKTWRLLTGEDYISSNDRIKVLLYTDKELDDTKLSVNINTLGSKIIYRLNSTMYYPLKNFMIDMSMDNLFSDTSEPKQLKKIADIKWEEDDLYRFTMANQKMIFIKEEEVEYTPLSGLEWKSGSVTYDNISQYQGYKLYNIDTDLVYDLQTECNDVVVDFYIIKEGYIDYQPVASFDSSESLDDYEFYKKVNDKYEKRYTLNQLISLNNSYVQQNCFTYQGFSNPEETPIWVNFYEYDQDNVIKHQGTISYNKNDKKFYLKTEDITELLTTSNSDAEDLEKMTNGEFWWKYRNESTTILKEKAALIEVNLSEYWTNAYYASKNCRFFIPEFWQPVINHQSNSFSSKILLTDGESISLSTTYIPTVTLFPKQTKYRFKHKESAEANTTITAATYKLPISENVSFSSICQQHELLQQMADYLNLNVSDWQATVISNDYALYQYEAGGMLWKEAIEKLSKGLLVYNYYGGWYDMMINVLQNCNYINYEPTLYYQAQQEHELIWSEIYTKYPNLIYEQTYTNENATSAGELLQMAQYAFQDYNTPETNYNISIIDLTSLKGYQGQELKIGDGVEVDASELYSNIDSDIYRSLSQYLFITDINYDLRRDDNIQLTVNSIKYQDKVIGQLIKLIR